MTHKELLMETLAKKLNKLCYDFVHNEKLHLKEIVIEPQQIRIMEFSDLGDGLSNVIYNIDMLPHLKELQDGK